MSSQHIASDVKSQMRKMLDDAWCDDDILAVSAKTGFGCDTLLERILDTAPPPKSDEPQLMFKGLLFDMFFHPIKGGRVAVHSERWRIAFGLASDVLTVFEVGILAPGMMPTDCLRAGRLCVCQRQEYIANFALETRYLRRTAPNCRSPLTVSRVRSPWSLPECSQRVWMSRISSRRRCSGSTGGANKKEPKTLFR